MGLWEIVNNRRIRSFDIEIFNFLKFEHKSWKSDLENLTMKYIYIVLFKKKYPISSKSRIIKLYREVEKDSTWNVIWKWNERLVFSFFLTIEKYHGGEVRNGIHEGNDVSALQVLSEAWYSRSFESIEKWQKEYKVFERMGV